MDDVTQSMWKGGTEPMTFPHRCPYRLRGASAEECIELSGSNQHHNRGGCCGTQRGSFRFLPCNSSERRCIVCLQIGRFGAEANAVTNVVTGTCDEHVNGIPETPVGILNERKRFVPRVSAKVALGTLRSVQVPTALPERPVPETFEVAIPVSEEEATPVLEDPEEEGTLVAERGREQGPLEEPVVRKHPASEEPRPAYERRKRGAEEKLAALEEASAELRKTTPQLQVRQLLKAAAAILRMTPLGLSRFYHESVPNEVKQLLLYGEGGKKVTRAEVKFKILMRVREEMRRTGGPAPRKKELAEAAAEPLGMTLDSTRTYIYDRLTPEEVSMLQLRKKFLTAEEQIAILKRVRQEMRDRGEPPPRQADLAKAAAPLLQQKVPSVRTLIVKLSAGLKEELEFSGYPPRGIWAKDPALVREGFLGAIAVLKLRNLPVTIGNLCRVLRLKQKIVETYLSEHPDIGAEFDKVQN